MHGIAAQKEVVVDGGQKDSAVMWAYLAPVPVPDSPTQGSPQSGMTRRNGAGLKIEPHEGRDTSGVMDDHYVGML